MGTAPEIALDDFFVERNPQARALFDAVRAAVEAAGGAEVAPGRFMHHLEVRAATDLDAEVLSWLREAREGAA